MTEWVGFTDADLQRMKNMSDGGKSTQPGGARIVKPITGGRPKAATNVGQKPQRKQNPRNVGPKPPKEGDVPQAAMLSKPPPKKVDVKKKVVSPPTTPNEQMPLHGKTSPPLTDKTEETPPEDSGMKEPNKEPEILEDVEVIQEKEKLQLADIQKRQKEMEEKNKRKKTLLTKAIAERKKKAFAESNKLQKLQAELAKLDDMLNYDVSIVRDKIDSACWEYNNAQKRFEKAEAEYIDAKVCLQRATDMKEELTEHLYKLIQLNEERKANKLEDLMQKLELEEADDPEPTTELETTQPSTTEPLKPRTESQTENKPEPTQEDSEQQTKDPPGAVEKPPETTIEENKTDPVASTPVEIQS